MQFLIRGTEGAEWINPATLKREPNPYLWPATLEDTDNLSQTDLMETKVATILPIVEPHVLQVLRRNGLTVEDALVKLKRGELSDSIVEELRAPERGAKEQSSGPWQKFDSFPKIIQSHLVRRIKAKLENTHEPHTLTVVLGGTLRYEITTVSNLVRSAFEEVAREISATTGNPVNWEDLAKSWNINITGFSIRTGWLAEMSHLLDRAGLPKRQRDWIHLEYVNLLDPIQRERMATHGAPDLFLTVDSLYLTHDRQSSPDGIKADSYKTRAQYIDFARGLLAPGGLFVTEFAHGPNPQINVPAPPPTLPISGLREVTGYKEKGIDLPSGLYYKPVDSNDGVPGMWSNPQMFEQPPDDYAAWKAYPSFQRLQPKPIFAPSFTTGASPQQALEASTVINPSQMSFVVDPSNGHRVLRSEVKMGGLGPPESGGTGWTHEFADPIDHAQVSFRVKFGGDFNSLEGGKLAGALRGGTWPKGSGEVRPNGTTQFTCGITFGKGLTLQLHVSHMDQVGSSGTNFPFMKDGLPIHFVPGRWYDIGYTLKLNTPGKADGEATAWIGGDEMATVTATGLRFRTESKLKVDRLDGSTSLSASASSRSTGKTEEIFYDRFRVAVVPGN